MTVIIAIIKVNIRKNNLEKTSFFLVQIKNFKKGSKGEKVYFRAM